MNVSSAKPADTEATWLSADRCRLADLLSVLDDTTRLEDYPHAARVEQQVLVYDAQALARTIDQTEGRRSVQDELVHALSEGPGVVVFEGAFEDAAVVDHATDAFNAMIDLQNSSGSAAGDHFAKPGANDRIWNALEKLAVDDAGTFVAYYANDILALVSAAWLGPGYQVTSSINVVNPGGEGQTVHRDYHLGFQSNDVAELYPRHVHALSPVLTLQGAVAHCDMPRMSGPTLYLPHSQKYASGYLAWRRPEFSEYFTERHVQLPLDKGDAVFFNPALFHAAGSNHSSDIKRMANLLQVSSAFGRAMESVDRERMSNALYPTLLKSKRGGMSERGLANVVATAAEGYSFPTNLDRDQPIAGLTPPTQAELVAGALAEEATPGELTALLAAQAMTKLSH